jgi:hypothetical protein
LRAKEHNLMATEDQYINAGHGAGSRQSSQQLTALTVSGNSTVKGSIELPAGSWFRGIQLETPVAISGTPTSALLRAGFTDGGQDLVADVDTKGQGHIAATIVAALDKIGGFANATTISVVRIGGPNLP